MVVALPNHQPPRALEPALARVLTYSDSFVVRSGLARVASAPPLEWTGETTCPTELEAAAVCSPCDLVLAAPGPTAARKAFPLLAALVARCHVLVLLPASATHQIIAAELHRRFGIFSLPIETTEEELHHTVRRLVQTGESRRAIRLEAAVSNAERVLTPREGQVLRELSTGSSNRMIAQKLMLSDDTVKTHLRNVYRKLGVRCRGEAIARYMGG